MSCTLEQKIGQLIFTGFRGLAPDPGSAFYNEIKSGRTGGIYISDKDLGMQQNIRNIKSPAQLRELTDELQALSPFKLLVGLDQEGFGVNRLRNETGFRDYFEGLTFDDDISGAAEETAAALREAGVSINFGPVVDLNINPDNPVIGRRGRSISADPEKVTAFADKMIRALQKYKIVPTLKHYPGHGSAEGDSHLGTADITETWQLYELEPYRRLIKKHKNIAVMTGHLLNKNIDPSLPSSLSEIWISKTLRNEIGFSGLVISDDLGMNAVSDHYTMEETIGLAFNAGCDIILYANNMPYTENIGTKIYDTLLSLLDKGVISKERIEEAYKRVEALKAFSH